MFLVDSDGPVASSDCQCWLSAVVVYMLALGARGPGSLLWPCLYSTV